MNLGGLKEDSNDKTEYIESWQKLFRDFQNYRDSCHSWKHWNKSLETIAVPYFPLNLLSGARWHFNQSPWTDWTGCFCHAFSGMFLYFIFLFHSSKKVRWYVDSPIKCSFLKPLGTSSFALFTQYEISALLISREKILKVHFKSSFEGCSCCVDLPLISLLHPNQIIIITILLIISILIFIYDLSVIFAQL